MQKQTKIEVRLTSEEKLSWQAQADALGTTVSDLVRTRMNSNGVEVAAVLASARPASPSPAARVPSGQPAAPEPAASPAAVEPAAVEPAAVEPAAPEPAAPRWSTFELLSERERLALERAGSDGVVGAHS